MIFLRSSLTDVAELPSLNQKSAAGTPSPGGSNERSECRPVCCSNSNERSECHFLCCSGVGWGSSERGERHFLCCSFVGELYHRGRQSAVIHIPTLVTSVFVRVHPWFKNTFLRNEPKFSTQVTIHQRETRKIMS
jgi:hypothetical protein